MNKYSYQIDSKVGDFHLLRERWQENDWSLLRFKLVANILANQDDLANFPKTEITAYGKIIKLLDFRCIDLKGLSIGEIDLSYCCFDGADFENCMFKETSFQYSTFRYANFANTQWNKVQASPVSLAYATLENAKLENSFFIGSDYAELNTEDIKLINTEFI